MISAFRPSKNFEIINKIIPYLKDDGFNYEFHITISDQDYNKLFKGRKWVRTMEKLLLKTALNCSFGCNVFTISPGMFFGVLCGSHENGKTYFDV